MTGDVIFVKRYMEYNIGDIITFEDDKARKVTHRISAIYPDSDSKFITKGDANRTEDNSVVDFNNIVGKVIYTVPGLGYFIVFGKKPVGIIIFILIPCVLIVFDEILSLFKDRT